MTPLQVKRRRLLGAIAAATCLPAVAPAGAHTAAGQVVPALPAPTLGVTLHTGRKAEWRELMFGKATAVQLMFTGCSATCPIQGALFAAVQRQIGTTSAPLQLISASIDPLGDDAKALQSWLTQFGAGPRWLGLVPGTKELDPWLDFLRGRATGSDKHTAQVYFFNRRAELTLRTVDFPRPAEVARLLVQLATDPAL